MTRPADAWSDPAAGTRDEAPYVGPPTAAAYGAPGYGAPGYGASHSGAPHGGPPADGASHGGDSYGGASYGGASYGGASYGAPYGGASSGAPYGVPYGAPYGGGPYGGGPYGGGFWAAPPAGPRRPGQVLAAAVLAFVQAAVVGFSSAYLLLLVSVAGLAADADPSFPGDGEALVTEGIVLASVQIGTVVLLVVGGTMGLGRGRAGRLTLLAGLGSQVALALYWAVRLWSLADDAFGPPSAFVLLAALCYAAVPGVALGLLATRQARAWAAGGAPAASATGAAVPGR